MHFLYSIVETVLYVFYEAISNKSVIVIVNTLPFSRTFNLCSLHLLGRSSALLFTPPLQYNLLACPCQMTVRIWILIFRVG